MLIEAYDLSYSYPDGMVALRGAYLKADRGEIVAVIGANGSGKTTLLLTIAGLIEPNGGAVLLEGKPLSERIPEVRRRIGFLFQDPDDQLFNPTVFDEIAFALRMLRIDEGDVEAMVRGIASKLCIDALLDRRPYRLSFGEKKLVSLASILVYDPDILILDEPFSGLTSSIAAMVEEVIRESKIHGKTIILAEHNLDIVARLADRVYVMSGGSILAEGKPEDIFYDEKLLSEAGLSPPIAVHLARSLHLEDRRIVTLEELLSSLKYIDKSIDREV